jgi:hypothetical protein
MRSFIPLVVLCVGVNALPAKRSLGSLTSVLTGPLGAVTGALGREKRQLDIVADVLANVDVELGSLTGGGLTELVPTKLPAKRQLDVVANVLADVDIGLGSVPYIGDSPINIAIKREAGLEGLEEVEETIAELADAGATEGLARKLPVKRQNDLISGTLFSAISTVQGAVSGLTGFL